MSCKVAAGAQRSAAAHPGDSHLSHAQSCLCGCPGEGSGLDTQDSRMGRRQDRGCDSCMREGVEPPHMEDGSWPAAARLAR